MAASALACHCCLTSGLVSGAPQLGAGAAIGTVGAAVGAGMLAGGVALAGARMAGAGGMAAIRAGTAMGSAASTSFRLGQATSSATGMAGVAAGVGGVARAAGGAVAQGVRSTAGRASSSLKESADAGRRTAWAATGGQPIASGPSSPSSTGIASAPDWAKKLRADQTRRAHAHATAQSIKDGDRPGASANPDLSSKDE